MRWFTRHQPVSDEQLRASIERALRLVCGEPTVHTHPGGTDDLSFGPASTLISHTRHSGPLSPHEGTTTRNEHAKPLHGHKETDT